MRHRPVHLGVLLSGSGRTLQNLIDRIADGRLLATIEIVIANRTDAYGLVRAEQARLPARVVDHRAYSTPQAFNDALFRTLAPYRVDLIVLAGFLRKIILPEAWHGRILNIHPALLPGFGGRGFYGHHVHEAVLAAGAAESGCTVHYVDEQYDHGPILVQKRVPVLPGDTPDSLAARVFEAECEAYPEAIRLWAEREAAEDSRNSSRGRPWQ